MHLNGSSSAGSTSGSVLRQPSVVMVMVATRCGMMGAGSTATAVMRCSGVPMMVDSTAGSQIFVMDILDVLEIRLVSRRRSGKESRGYDRGARRLGLATACADTGTGVVLPAGLVLPLTPGLVPVFRALLLLRSAELVMLGGL